MEGSSPNVYVINDVTSQHRSWYIETNDVNDNRLDDPYNYAPHKINYNGIYYCDDDLYDNSNDAIDNAEIYFEDYDIYACNDIFDYAQDDIIDEDYDDLNNVDACEHHQDDDNFFDGFDDDLHDDRSDDYGYDYD